MLNFCSTIRIVFLQSCDKSQPSIIINLPLLSSQGCPNFSQEVRINFWLDWKIDLTFSSQTAGSRVKTLHI